MNQAPLRGQQGMKTVKRKTGHENLLIMPPPIVFCDLFWIFVLLAILVWHGFLWFSRCGVDFYDSGDSSDLAWIVVIVKMWRES